MAYGYGHKATAFNGIWLWLQRNGYCKATRSNDKSYNFCISMIRDFLTSKGMKVEKFRGHFDTRKNANKVQDFFHEFVAFMKNKEVPGND